MSETIDTGWLTDPATNNKIAPRTLASQVFDADGESLYNAIKFNKDEETLVDDIDIVKKNDIIDLIYPIGSIYMSVNNVSPSTFLSGTWEQIKDTFLLSAGDTYSAGSTGGEATHTLSTAEMPSHSHTFTGSSATTASQSASTTAGQSTSTTGANSRSHTHSFARSYGAAGRNDWGLVGEGAFGGNVLLSTGQTSTLTYSNGENQNHTHSYAHTHTYSHTHTLTAKGSNSNTGSGSAHNNMPPYLAVYMWKRTA